jgi:hypothetical protein
MRQMRDRHGHRELDVDEVESPSARPSSSARNRGSCVSEPSIGAARDSEKCAVAASSPTTTSSRSISRNAAISAGVGVRPVRSAISRAPRSTRSASSFALRGTCVVQPVSRKWRLSSPRIVGIANDLKAIPRDGSNRSIAPSSPTEATCVKSSSGSYALR